MKRMTAKSWQERSINGVELCSNGDTNEWELSFPLFEKDRKKAVKRVKELLEYIRRSDEENENRRLRKKR